MRLKICCCSVVLRADKGEGEGGASSPVETAESDAEDAGDNGRGSPMRCISVKFMANKNGGNKRSDQQGSHSSVGQVSIVFGSKKHNNTAKGSEGRTATDRKQSEGASENSPTKCKTTTQAKAQQTEHTPSMRGRTNHSRRMFWVCRGDSRHRGGD